MKILHTGDIHLGSVLSHRFSAEQAGTLRRELLSAFAGMLSYAKENGFRAVLIDGDLSDAGELPYAAQRFLLEAIAAAAPVDVFYTAGNHDPVCFSRETMNGFPDNFHVFGDTWETVSLGGNVTLTSRRLPKYAVPPVPPVLSEDTCNLVMLHGALSDGGLFGGESSLIPKAMPEGLPIDYLALGHYHAFHTVPLGIRGTACYAGCPAGRGFDECGEKGFASVTIEDRAVSVSFVPYAKRTFRLLTLDTDTLPSADTHALGEAIDALTSALPARDIVRLTLTGTDHADVRADTAYLEGRLAERFFHAELCDERTAQFDGVSYQNDISLRGAFVRSVTASDLTEREKNEILRLGLAALSGEDDGGDMP